MGQLQDAAITRAVWSRRQLLEVMVDFWSNHLNVTCPSSEVWDSRASYDREAIRPNALGRFADLLKASAHSPAMLRYLTNVGSTTKNPNENYGRELLELHTVGRDAGYSQADVRASSLTLTGLTVDKNNEFAFRADQHFVGPLRVLGWSAPNDRADGGLQVVDSYLEYLAHHPATAAHLAYKLAVRFVSDDPPRSLVDRLAATYLASGTAITPVLRALFTSTEFAASAGAKARRPLDDLVATVRTLGLRPAPGAQVQGVQQLRWALGSAGQAPLAWHAPDGYPDTAPAWAGPGSLFTRWETHNLLVGGWVNGLTKPDLAPLAGPAPATWGAALDAIGVSLLGQPLPAGERAALLGGLGLPAAGPAQQLDKALPKLTVLVLNSPSWSTR